MEATIFYFSVQGSSMCPQPMEAAAKRAKVSLWFYTADKAATGLGPFLNVRPYGLECRARIWNGTGRSVEMMNHMLMAHVAYPDTSTGGAKTENFREWVLEQRGGSPMVTLSFKQSASVNNQLATSELAFICDQRHKSTSIGVMLIPFDGTFDSHRDPVPVSLQFRKTLTNMIGPMLSKIGGMGNEFLFLDGKDDVAELVSLFKERDSSPENSVHFLFPNDVNSGPPVHKPHRR